MKFMNKLNLAFFETVKWEEKYLREQLKGIKNLNLSFSPNSLSTRSATKYKNADVLIVFIYSSVTKEILEKMPKLKYIATMSTGFDHIDIQACQAKGISVSNVPYYGENTVAEHTFALIFALARRLPESIARTHTGQFSPEGLMGFDLKGKTIGLIGLGHIGKHVAKIAHGLEMNILAYDPKKDNRLTKEYKVKYCSLDTLLKNSDIISLHAPYNKNTHHLINKTNIKNVKRGAYIINTSRGGLIDTEALLMALDNKIVAGAGLDVLEEEAFIKEEKELLARNFQSKCDLKTVLRSHTLIYDPRVIVTPHNAFNSKEALERILDTTADNIESFTKGKIINKIK